MAADAFIGRRAELEGIAAALSDARLVVLTGPSGVGKTRLARELAHRLAPGYPQGARFAELAAITDDKLVPTSVARVFAIAELPARTPMEALVARLRSMRLLLILDNCEHLIGACALLCERLLGACPKLAILATSQMTLGISGERVWPVAPLSLPAESAPAESLETSEAVSLFCARARALTPSFRGDADSLPVVAEICRRLDGIPLAIELAAARIAVLSPRQLAARLDQRFEVLTGGSRAVLPRHQTLQMALDWSHNLLSQPERRLLRRLSAFAGSFGFDAVGPVCADDDDDQLLDPLSGLISKSFITADTGGGEARYHMLETIRLYAAGLLADAGETEAVHARHAGWYLGLGETAQPHLTGSDQTAWLQRLDAEHDNFRAAQAWAVAGGDGALAMGLSSSLPILWRVRGYLGEGRERLAAALELGGDDAPAELRVRALWGLGFMALMLHEQERCQRALSECLSLSREVGDRATEARTLLLLGNAGMFWSDRASALALLTESAAQAATLGDTWCQAHALAVAGRVHLDGGRIHEARVVLSEALDLARHSRDAQSQRIALVISSYLEVGQGNYDVATRLLAEAQAVGDRLHEPYTLATTLDLQGVVAVGRGEYDRAEELFSSSLALAREGGVTRSITDSLTHLATAVLSGGDAVRAGQLLDEALAIGAEEGATVFPALVAAADQAIVSGDPPRAQELLMRALHLARDGQDSHTMAEAASRLGRLARTADARQAMSHSAEAANLWQRRGYAPGIAQVLEDVGGLAADAGVHDRAARLLGAAHALRQAQGYARFPHLEPRYEEDLAAAREALGPAGFDREWNQGAQLTTDEAVSYALKGWGQRLRDVGGWPGLSRTERDIIVLVADGFTNADIGRRLFMSPRTVESHLTHVFSKLGLRSRRELAQEVRRKAVQS